MPARGVPINHRGCALVLCVAGAQYWSGALCLPGAKQLSLQYTETPAQVRTDGTLQTRVWQSQNFTARLVCPGRWFRAVAATGNLQPTEVRLRNTSPFVCFVTPCCAPCHLLQAQKDSNWHWQSVAAAAAAFGFCLSGVAQCEPNQQARACNSGLRYQYCCSIRGFVRCIGCLGQDERCS